MRAEHAGQGSYTYECRKQDCWHCEHYGLKPLPEIWEDKPDPKPMYIKIKRLRHWSKKELNVIRENQHLTAKKIQRKLPNRSLTAVHIKIMQMIRRGVL